MAVNQFKEFWKNLNKTKDEPEWITVRGAHIPIKPGQSKSDAVASRFDSLKDKKDDSKVAKKEYGQKKITDPDKFERSKDISGGYRDIEDKAYDKISEHEDDILVAHKKEKGNVVNADDFKSHFKDIGYDGSNAAAVQEPSSYLGKRAYTENLKNGGEYAMLYAGSSGSGKTSAIDKLSKISKMKNKSAVILDGNLSGGSSSVKKVAEAVAAGKKPVIPFVYRKPEQALNGVISRMFDNPKEGGRLVPTKVIANNMMGSWKNVSEVLPKEFPGIKRYFIDNSAMGGEPKIVSEAQMASLVSYPATEEELVGQFNEEIKKLYEDKAYCKKIYGNTLTKKQYQGYIS